MDAGAEGRGVGVEVVVARADGGGADWGTGRGTLFAVGPPGPRGLRPFTFPLTLSVGPTYTARSGQGASGEGGPSLAFAAYGEGPLREGGAGRLRIHMTPPTLGTPLYGDRHGRYYAGLLAPRYDLEGGDIQAVSGALHEARGFGAVTRVRLGPADRLPTPGQRRDDEGAPFEAAAFAVWGRYGFLSDTTYGGRLAVSSAVGWGLGVTGTRHEGFFEGDVATADVRLGRRDTYARVEAGAARQEGIVTPGFTAEGRASGRWGSLAARAQEVGHSFPSYSANARRYNGSARLLLGSGWALTAVGDHVRRGAFLGGAGPRDYTSARGEASVQYGAVAALRYLYAGQQQALGATGYRSAEHLGEISGQTMRGRWALGGRLRAGTVAAESPQGPASNPVFGVSASARYALGRASATVSANYARGSGTALPGLPTAEAMQLTMQAAVPFGAVSLHASATASWYRQVTTAGYFFADAGASMALPWGHRLNASARVSGPLPGASAFGGRFVTVGLNYAVPLGIPLGQSRQTGLVSGSLADDASGRGLAAVPVFLEAGGQRVSGTLTDAEGRFWLGAAPAGPASVVVEDGGPGGVTGAAFVVRDGARVPVEVVGGREATLDLRASALGEVAAEVVLLDTLRGPHGEVSRVERRGVPGATLALRDADGAEILTRTDGGGTATFRRVYPGSYVLRVVGAPAEHAAPVGPDSTAVEVTASGHAEAIFAYVPVRRTVRFLAEGAVELGAAPVALETVTAPQAGTRTYVVQPGDWLAKIARNVYGGDGLDTWPRLFEANRHLLQSPEILEPGMELTIPPLD